MSPKDGLEEIAWDGGAALIRGSELEVDNAVLMRLSVGPISDGAANP